jgi:hypothetical protein
MNISELFEKLQDKFLPEEINGEFSLHGNCIIWEYNLDNDSEEISISTMDEDEEQYFVFEASSPEEILLETHGDVLEQVEFYLDELEELDNWTISESEIVDNTISFKIF